MRKIFFLMVIILMMFVLCGNAAAETPNNESDNSTIYQTSENLKEFQESSDPKIFLISDVQGTNVLNMAANNVLGNFTGEISIQVRNNGQIERMKDGELLEYLKNSDIFIGEWLSTGASTKLSRVIESDEQILNKDRGLFLILEPSDDHVELMKYSTYNKNNLLKDFSFEQLQDYRENTKRGTEYSKVLEYLEKSEFPEIYNTAILYKNLNDRENIRNQILWALSLLGFNTNFKKPEYSGKQSYGIYRYKGYTFEDYKKDYFKDDRKYCVGLIESTMYVDSQNLEPYYQIIEELEKRGCNVLPVTAYGATPEQLKVMVETFTNAPDYDSFAQDPSKYKINVDAIIVMVAYGLGGSEFTQVCEFFEKLNVPVIRAVHSDYISNEDWEMDNLGLRPIRGDRWWHITILERQGIIEPTFIGGYSTKIDPQTGAEVVGYVPQMENIERLAERVKNWAQLRYMDSSEKNIAIIYYNYPPGKHNIGASYLDSIKSIFNLLKILKDEGYQVENLPESPDELLELMLKQGINVANWAPGELEKLVNSGDVILYPVKEYMEWFSSLDSMTQTVVKEGPIAYIGELCKKAVKLGYTKNMEEKINNWKDEIISLIPENRLEEALPIIEKVTNSLKKYVFSKDPKEYEKYLQYKRDFISLKIEGISGWGEPPGDIMVVEKNGEKYFVIPGIKLGNVIVAPQPQRGWEGDPSKLYHNSVVPPHHQYLALYAYLQNMDTSAMVYIGRHGTHEWLPGKEVLLSPNDYPNIVSGAVPQLYYYIVDGVAEGEQAKRRGSAVIIDHLTPPMTLTKLYGGFSKLADLVESYDIADVDKRQEIIKEIKEIIKTNHLENDIQVDLEKVSDDDLIKNTENYLLEIQNTFYPYGLHVIGEQWSEEKIALLVASMVSVPIELPSKGEPRSTTLQNEISLAIKGNPYDKLSLQERDEILNKCVEIIKDLISSDLTAVASKISTNPSEDLKIVLEKAVDYINRVRESTDNEINSLLNGLCGGYISPGPGSDPIANPDAVPTGRNFFHDQAYEIPTKSAYEYGSKLVLEALKDLDDEVEKIAVGVWCVETARDDGALVSFVLQLIGVEPDWSDSPSAGPGGKKLKEMPKYVDLDELVRPEGYKKKRIDVVVITSGLFRDIYSRQLGLIDKGFRIALARSYYTILKDKSLKEKYGSKIVNALEKALSPINFYGLGSESLEDNYVAKHWVEDVTYYLDKGMKDEEAGELAISRVFAPPDGDYGAGISNLVEMSWTWDDRTDLADHYLNRMAHLYSANNWGISSPDTFKRILQGISTVFTSRNTNLYGVVDIDDYFDYWGGLSMAIERINGKSPNMFVLYYANRANPESVSLEHFMYREMRTRYFNPEWIKGMMQYGYSGARSMSTKFVSNLWGWQVTNPNLVKGWMWDEVTDIYVKDKYQLGLNQWLSQGTNAYSMISITGTLLTAAHKGYWNPDKATLEQVANTWANLIAQHGVACCDCSCGNIAMMKWATQFINPNLLAELNSQLYQATKNPTFAESSPGIMPTPTSPGEQMSTEISTATSAGPLPSKITQEPSAGQQGEKAYEVTKVTPPGSSASGVPIWAVLGVILLTGLAILGYFKASILGFILRR